MGKILKERAQYGVKQSNYKLVVPDGGWGYLVTISISVMLIGTVVPNCVFGVVYGSFLDSISDETYGTALANGIFNTVQCFTGLPANWLLQVYSYRKVGVVGAILFCLGNFGIVFVTNLTQFILAFSVLQGVGFGLMLPASYTAFNEYFDQRKNAIMGLCQAVVAAITVVFPIFTTFLMDSYGWRGTALIFVGVTLQSMWAMLTFQPVKWHMKRVRVTDVEMHNVTDRNKSVEEEQTLLLDNRDLEHMSHQNSSNKSSIIISNIAMSVGSLNTPATDTDNQLGFLSSLAASLDLDLFKSAKYLNISFGLALSSTSDLAFMSLLPLILVNNGFTSEDLTLVMCTYFSADLVCRLLLSLGSAVCHVRNRYVFLLGTALSALFRILFVMDNTFWWILMNSVALGFLRCFIQTPLPLVIAEEYGERFTSAFSLYMVVCGVVSLIFGPLIGYVKEITGSDIMVVHLLTGAYLLCAVPWAIELLVEYVSERSKRKIIIGAT